MHFTQIKDDLFTYFLQFTSFFNSILVISGGEESDNERLCLMELFTTD